MLDEVVLDTQPHKEHWRGKHEDEPLWDLAK